MDFDYMVIDEAEEILTPPCPQCGGQHSTPLGTWGPAQHWRCRFCGWTYSTREEGGQ